MKQKKIDRRIWCNDPGIEQKMALIIGLVWNKISEALENRGIKFYRRISTLWRKESSENTSKYFSDTRIDHLPFTSPLSAILISISYVYFVKSCGPSFMSKRKPFAIEKLIIIYNLIQIILNVALFSYVN